MSFRQPKSHRHVDERRWQEWLSRHELQLRTAGVPPSVTASESHWIDFLANGCLDFHREEFDGFMFDQMSSEQMAGLLHVLDGSPEFSTMPIAGWIRHRLEIE